MSIENIETSTASLQRLAQMLDFDLGDVDELPTGDSAQIVRVQRNGEIAIRSLDGQHPYDALLGFVAPDDWEVFGVIAPGWGTYYAGPKEGERRRCRAIHVASRRGEEAALLRFAGEELGEVVGANNTPGRVADCIRRALDLPTAPATDASLLQLWFDRTLRQLVARNHPSFGGALVDLDAMEDIIGEGPLSWGDERWAVVQAGGNDRMDGAIASWMDDGMYARLVLSELDDAAVALPVAKRVCTPEAWTAMLSFFVGEFLGDDCAEFEDDGYGEDDEDDAF